MLVVKDFTLTLARQPLMQKVNFSVHNGEILTLMGASGSGKSTLFAWMAGALPSAFQAEGELWLNARRCDTLPTEARQMGILFQDALLFAHLTVGQNLLLALPATVVGSARKARVIDALNHAGLAGFYHRDPATLSGGQRARVSVLRALLAQPQALLLDEPYSRLDTPLRNQFRHWVFTQVSELAIPVVMVTHDSADQPVGGRCLNLEQWR